MVSKHQSTSSPVVPHSPAPVLTSLYGVSHWTKRSSHSKQWFGDHVFAVLVAKDADISLTSRFISIITSFVWICKVCYMNDWLASQQQQFLKPHSRLGLSPQQPSQCWFGHTKPTILALVHQDWWDFFLRTLCFRSTALLFYGSVSGFLIFAWGPQGLSVLVRRFSVCLVLRSHHSAETPRETQQDKQKSKSLASKPTHEIHHSTATPVVQTLHKQGASASAFLPGASFGTSPRSFSGSGLLARSC